ncbi:MAG: flagellar hook-length control protein FliK [Magnetococcales bacterium]|nr:flagellar hook-length control protein FliK [Magnetococcales bacterium]
MTLLKMTLPQVESRPAVSVDRPSVTKSAEEGTARVFEEALQKAGAIKQSKSPSQSTGKQESSTTTADKSATTNELESGSVAKASGEAAKAGDVAKEAQNAKDAKDAQNAQEASQESVTDDQTQAAAVQEEKPVADPAGANPKNRPNNRKKGDEVWLALPQAMMAVANLTCQVAPSSGQLPEGALSATSANIPSLSPQGAVPGQPFPGLQPGGAPVAGGSVQELVVPASLPQKLAEAMGARGAARAENTLPPSLIAADDKNDFAFAMRLVSDGASSAATKPGVPSQTTLTAQSPAFGEDLADEVGRLRVISRPGSSEQVRITLHPKDMGSLDMRLVVDEEHQVHLMITTDSDAARDLLNRQMPQLRDALARQNLGMGEVTVHVNDGSDGFQASEWGFQGGQAENDNRRDDLIWRGGRGIDSGSGVEETMAAPLPGVSGGGSGLSLFA